MTKKVVGKKKSSKKKSVKKNVKKSSSIDKALISNFVSLQRVLTNLTVKIDNLTTQTSKLLELFEISAKSLAEKEFKVGEEKNQNKIESKLDELIDQNKLLAKGVTLMHEGTSPNFVQTPPVPMPPQRSVMGKGYMKSLPTKSQDFQR